MIHPFYLKMIKAKDIDLIDESEEDSHSFILSQDGQSKSIDLIDESGKNSHLSVLS